MAIGIMMVWILGIGTYSFGAGTSDAGMMISGSILAAASLISFSIWESRK